ncbi:hypothetical protein ERJ75_000493700 [Trypanosoma vivax]|nr:hypothetical protein ERJ75_000493700 [Trypanosoma vivax]
MRERGSSYGPTTAWSGRTPGESFVSRSARGGEHDLSADNGGRGSGSMENALLGSFVLRIRAQDERGALSWVREAGVRRERVTGYDFSAREGRKRDDETVVRRRRLVGCCSGVCALCRRAAGDNEHDYAALCGALREAEAVRGMAQDILREAAVCGGISDSEECDTTAWNGTEGAVKGALKQTLLSFFRRRRSK